MSGVKSLSVIILLSVSYLGYSQGIVPYLTVSDTVLCWDLKGSKKLYEFTVKARYSDSLNAINDSIIKSYFTLLEGQLKKNEIVKSKLIKSETKLTTARTYGFALFTLLGLVLGLMLN